MATVNIKGSAFCPGNAHFTVTLTGALNKVFQLSTPEILGQSVSQEEAEAAMVTILKLWSAGKTPAQAKTGILAGFDVVV